MTKPTMVQVCFVCLARWRRSGCVPPLFTERRFDHAAVGGLLVEIEADELILLFTGRSRPRRIPLLGSDHARGRGPNAYGVPVRNTQIAPSNRGWLGFVRGRLGFVRGLTTTSKGARRPQRDIRTPNDRVILRAEPH